MSEERPLYRIHRAFKATRRSPGSNMLAHAALETSTAIASSRQMCASLSLAVIAVEVTSTVSVHTGDKARRRVPHGAIEIVSRALAIEHARGGVVKEAGGKVGRAQHL